MKLKLFSFLFFFTLINIAQNNFLPPVGNPFGLTANISPAGIYKPFFVDIDADGDLDILSGGFDGNFYYYQNTGTNSSPVFANPVKNPFGLQDIAQDSTVSMVDIDNDGDLDLLSGNINGFIIFFRNTGSATAPSFGRSSVNPWGLTTVTGMQSEPVWVDLDGDGDFDVLSGDAQGNWKYFENTGSASSPSYGAQQNNPFNLINDGGRNTPFFIDFDNDNDLDLFVGRSNRGTIVYYQNTGTRTNPSFPSRIANPFGFSGNFSQTSPSLGDIDADGDFDLILGNSGRNFQFYENTLFNTAIVNIPDANFKNYLIGNTSLNTNGDGEIQVSEAEDYRLSLNIPFTTTINDLTGLEAFTSATVLNCEKCNVNSVDLTKNTRLRTLTLRNSNITNIDLSNNSLLNLNLSSNRNLTSLNLSNMSNLIELNVSGTNISTLNVSQNAQLKKLYLTSTTVSQLMLENNTNLEVLNLEDNFSILDLSFNTKLKSLFIGASKNLPASKLSNLNLSSNINLESLSINTRELVSISLPTVKTNLNNIALLNTGISTLNLSGASQLERLRCSNSNITELDASSLTSLKALSITSSENLESINLKNGNNTNITSFFITNNPKLLCVDVDNVAYANSNFVNKDNQTVFSTDCSTTLSTTKNSTIISKIYPNPVSNTLKIKTDNNVKKITVFNLLGKAVLKTNQKNIDVTTLNSGVYFLNIETKSGQIEAKKFVKK